MARHLNMPVLRGTMNHLSPSIANGSIGDLFGGTHLSARESTRKMITTMDRFISPCKLILFGGRHWLTVKIPD